MQNKGRRIYGIKINYQLMNDFLSHIGEMRAAKKRGDVSEQFEKRIMLAVTQVNGCRLCSYYHTKEALKMGMPETEIKSMLSGELGVAPEEEAVALAFAQHYAETIGNYDADAWHRPRRYVRRAAGPQHTRLHPRHHDGQRAGQHHGRLKITLSRRARSG